MRRRFSGGFVGLLCLACLVPLGRLTAQEAPPPPSPDVPAPVRPPAHPPVAHPARQAPAEPAQAPAVPAAEPAQVPVQPAQPIIQPPVAEPEEPKTTTDYFRELNAREVASVGDALRAIYLLHTGKDQPGQGSEARGEALALAGIVPRTWIVDPRAGLTKGQLAHMVCRALGIQGGVMNWATRQSRRYAFRECVYRKLMAGESHEQYVSGGELLSVLRRCHEQKKLEEGR